MELHRTHWPKWEGQVELREMYEVASHVAAARTHLQSNDADSAANELHRAQANDRAREAYIQAMLALSSDWAFMVTKDSAADYARRRAAEHTARFTELAAALRAGRKVDERIGVFGHLDARDLRKDRQ